MEMRMKFNHKVTLMRENGSRIPDISADVQSNTVYVPQIDPELNFEEDELLEWKERGKTVNAIITKVELIPQGNPPFDLFRLVYVKA